MAFLDILGFSQAVRAIHDEETFLSGPPSSLPLKGKPGGSMRIGERSQQTSV